MWYSAENNAIGGQKQNKKNKAENIQAVLSGRLVRQGTLNAASNHGNGIEVKI